MEMSVTENKFIIMSRIAVLLNRKGLMASLSINGKLSFSHLCVQDGDSDSMEILEWIYSGDTTEEELLNWLGVLENE